MNWAKQTCCRRTNAGRSNWVQASVAHNPCLWLHRVHATWALATGCVPALGLPKAASHMQSGCRPDDILPLGRKRLW